MAITITPSGVAPGRGGYGRPLFVRGNQRFGCVPFFLDMDGSYPQATGGYDISAIFAEFKLETNAANVMIFVSPRLGWSFDVDYTNKKLKAYSTANTEVANGVSLATATQVRCLAFGPLG